MPRSFCEQLAIEHPVVQAPIGNAATPILAAAVSNAGGLGMLSLTWSSPAQIRRLIQETQSRTEHPFGVNFVLEWPQHERIALALELGVRVVSTFWGDPTPYASRIRDAGAAWLHTVGDVAEARAAVDAGADMLVAQGAEAGGHVRGTMQCAELLAALRDTYPETPVVVAGGIVDGADAAAARAAGAAGVWVGTRFVCSNESDAADEYKQRIVAAGPGDTVLTTLFSRGWAEAPHRVLVNSTVRAAAASGGSAGGDDDDADVIAHTQRGRPIERYAFALPSRQMSGQLEAMAMYAGEGSARVADILPAQQITRELAAGWWQ